MAGAILKSVEALQMDAAAGSSGLTQDNLKTALQKLWGECTALGAPALSQAELAHYSGMWPINLNLN